MGRWLAQAWGATLTKSVIGAALGAILSWLMTSNVEPVFIAIGSAVIPLLINALNKYDPRYGMGKLPMLSDVANMPEITIEGEDT